MRILVTGASGALGGRLAVLLARWHTVVAGQHRAATPAELDAVPLDLLSSASLESAFDRSAPDAVLHAGALAEPDRCEREPEAAQALNVGASARVAETCARRGLRLVSLSTDLVFPGQKLVYARTKEAGEEATLAALPAAAVARVALVIGRGFGPRPTASEAVAWSLAEGRRVRLFTDQFRTPIDPESLADALVRLLQGAAAGLFQLGGAERVSRHELGLRTARRLGLDEGLIDAALAAELQAAAPRPADVSLDSSRAFRELAWTPRPLDLAIGEGRPRPTAP